MSHETEPWETAPAARPCVDARLRWEAVRLLNEEQEYIEDKMEDRTKKAKLESGAHVFFQYQPPVDQKKNNPR